VTLLASALSVAFLGAYSTLSAKSWLTVGLIASATAVYLVAYAVGAHSRWSHRAATDFGLLALVLGSWLASGAHHFGYVGRIDMLTGALLPAFTVPLFAEIGPGRFVPGIGLMAAAQPVLACFAYASGPHHGDFRDLMFSFLGASIAAAIAWGGCFVMLQARREGARDVGGYRLVRRIGSGGMGEVWEGKHQLLARPAAIKLLALRGRPQARLEARFTREAQATALLTSQHTVRLFDFGRSEDGRFYYVMELLEGLDLQRLVEQNGPLRPEQAVHVLVEACDSLGEAHQRGFVHRDIKPANLFLARAGLCPAFLKVLDFGLVASVSFGEELTLGGGFVGTAAYAPPEALAGRGQDERSDVYQLGCVLYFLITGRPVFDRPTPIAAALAHSLDVPLPLGQVARVPVPRDLEALVARCLSKDPNDRPATAGELRDALLELSCYEVWQSAEALRLPSLPPRSASEDGREAHPEA
jgi:serine/threonine-protein kinase